MSGEAQPSPFHSSAHDAISACFLGPRAENFDILEELFRDVLADHAKTRIEYNPSDGDFITSSMKTTQQFQGTVDDLRTQTKLISDLLNTYSIPFFSTRYMGHMCMETSMPSIVGWLTTMLFNPNNVAYEASPITTIIELNVGQDLCEMLGYPAQGTEKVSPWGHIATDGTVANMEAMWAARNLKFYPLSLHAAMTKEKKPLAFIADTFTVTTCDDPNTPQPLSKLTPWQLLNLTPDVVLGIADRLTAEYGITADFLAAALGPYLAQTTGKEKLMDMYDIELEPRYLISNTKHYSWPKAAALVGIGSENCVDVKVDDNARVDIDALTAALQECVKDKRAVYAVVAIIGSTEEGAVDPLDQILALKPQFAEQGLSFIVHADAAWGGYYASMIRDKPATKIGLPREGEDPDRDFVPSITLRDSTVAQFKALAETDSITIDPHKAGYIPYPAGGLCYRDGRMRFLLTWSAPYLHQGDKGESIGIYGIEGSKPGAPAVACYLHHSVLGLHKEGHGALLGEASFTCRRFAAYWSAMSDDTTDFVVIPFNPVQNESDKTIIRERILGKTNEEIVDDTEAFNVLCTLGSDLNINAFACNFRINGKVNDDVEEANYLNNRVFSRFSITSPQVDPKTVQLFLSSTVFAQDDYGDCVRNFQTRMGLETDSRQDLFVLRNVVMSPFQSAGDFVQNLAEIFQAGLEEEVKNVVARNTVSPQIHDFTMQGVNNLYLAYHPLFYHVNGRQQLIVAAQFSNPLHAAEYKMARLANPTVPFKLSTHSKVTIDDILNTHKLVGDITAGSAIRIPSVPITVTAIVKDRPLNSRWRDQKYPEAYTPFYLYGTKTEHHVDHMLLRAPNAQIASDLVTVNCTPALTADQYARGVIAYLNRPEDAMQPLTGDSASFFKPGSTFDVTIFADPNAATAHGPGLSKGGAQLAKGTITLGKAVYYDAKTLNTEDFASGLKVSQYTSTDMSQSTKAEWHTVVRGALGIDVDVAIS
ncbi:PLP-dependent transferase [Cubamyces sp. BRFM 1775]|nr:PLP-dependent transferase [Cubamyces sp. BRFM 1775]